ncbi:MAG: hypothetical protein IJC52_04205, partial [Clostridia bacterium]|nr:hypothetical protein [Clostridia bacterium]
EQYVYGYLLAAEEISDVIRNKEGMYYFIDSAPERTRYLFLDTAYKGVDTAQQEFIKEALLSTPDGWHIVAVSHIWYDTDWTDSDNPVVGELNSGAAVILAMFDNYNSRIGEYADGGGWVEFCVGGHTHWDHDGTSATGIPIVLVETDSKHTRSGLTYTAGTTTEASVNGIVADYDNHKIYVVRIGRGESREVAITNYVVSYTNVLPAALAADGVSVYNATETPGYKKDTRWSSSGNVDQTQEGTYITGYIPFVAGDVIRLKNIVMPNVSGTTCMLHLFKSLTDTSEGNVTYDNLVSNYNPVWDDSGNLKQFTIPTPTTYQYMRIQCGGIDATSVITINEPIE